MAYKYIEFEYPISHVFQKMIVWLSANANIYYAMKLNYTDSWTYYAAEDTGHALATGRVLTKYSTEGDAQTNYLTTDIDTNGKVLAVLPANFEAKYVRLYISEGSGITVWEWRPSINITAHDIVTGELEITNQLSDNPSIKITVDGNERVYAGNLGSDVYGLRGKDSSGNVIFEVGSGSDHPFVENYADHTAIELELMKINFQHISWASRAIYDAFDDETKRLTPDPATYNASVYRSKIYNGGDNTAGREFEFNTATYTNITNIETGTSTSHGANYLVDTTKNWFTDEVKNASLVDSDSTVFSMSSNTATRIELDASPASGAYTIRDYLPGYAVAFCSYAASSNGGDGFVKLEVSFNASDYQTFLDTENSIDYLGGTRDIDVPGRNYCAKITLKNNGAGTGGGIVYKYLVCTDPTPWRF